ncbi:flagellar basal body rod C-terminal domain-containing protein, partial [Neptuniibacter sp.]|uniref:flagellar basal body rod C-terminal domain-containing protein n=1 Tax=Neptuniibacter sp. TaxID=1962643 RepID=UPI0026286436
SAAPGSLDIPGIGLSLDVTGVPVVGDTFTIQPDAHTNGNANAAVTNVRITDDRLVGDVTYPLTVIYDAASTEFSVYDSATPAMTLFRGPWDNGTLDLTQTYGFAIDFDAAEVPADGDIFTIQHDPDSTEAAYVVLTDADGERALKENTPGQPITLSGYEITVKNRPDVGDRFTVNLNIDGVSDNRNALLMSDLQFTRTIEGASYQDKYGQTVEQVGTQAAVAQVNAQAGKTVLDANKQMRDSISGVNLDEEAAKLVQYQQAYQASAQLIRASQTIFDALLQSV